MKATLAVTIVATVVLGCVGVAMAVRVLLQLPTDFLSGGVPAPLFGRSASNAARALERVAGVLLVAIGVLLSLPGVPGPGLVLIAIGLMLMDFRGAHRLVRRMLRRPRPRQAANRIRRRFGREPMAPQK